MKCTQLKLNAGAEFIMHAILEVVWNGAYSPKSIEEITISASVVFSPPDCLFFK